MDLDLLKTFLEVHRVHHFGRAAENLFITPSAVSARIRQLEEQAGAQLFNRSRNNIHLTEAGERLLNHAKAIVNAWERARYELLSGAGAGVGFVVAAVSSAWDALLPKLARLRLGHPELLLRLEALSSEAVRTRLLQGQADLGLTVEPIAAPELQIREIGALELVLVATEARRSPEAAVGDGYIVADWGSAFTTRHAALYPDALLPATWASNGAIAHRLLLEGGGRGCYLPLPLVAPDLKGRRLFRVADSVDIELPVYAAYPAASRHEALIDELLGRA